MYIISAARSKIVYVVIMTPVTHPEKSFTLTLALLQAIRYLSRTFWRLEIIKTERRNECGLMYSYSTSPQQNCLIFLHFFIIIILQGSISISTHMESQKNINVVSASSILGCFRHMQSYIYSLEHFISVLKCMYIFFL